MRQLCAAMPGAAGEPTRHVTTPSGMPAGLGGLRLPWGQALGAGRAGGLLKPRLQLAQALSFGVRTDPQQASARQRLREWRRRQQQQQQQRREPLASGGGGGGRAGADELPSGGDGDGDGAGGWHFNPLAGLLAGIAARMEADPDFLYKLAVECGLDASIIIGVNLATRRKQFLTQLEFVGCQLAVSLLNDFSLVYLLAPTTRQRILVQGTWQAAMAALPSHAFQAAGPGRPRFTAAQRLGCLLLRGLQYGAIGGVMGCAGTAAVHGLSAARAALDEDYVPPPTTQPILGTGLGWMYFMALSSNVRYNSINALEDWLYASFPGPKSKAASIGLRLANNVYASFAWLALAQQWRLNQPRHCSDDDIVMPAGPAIEPLAA